MKVWINQIKEEANPNVIIYLVGNKIDLPPENRTISEEEGKKMANEYKLLFKEATAKAGTNVNEIFQELVEKIDAESKPELPNQRKK